MERLTKRINVDGLCEIAVVEEQDLDDALERLADYEDTGYMPEEIEALTVDSKCLQDIANLDGLIAGVINSLKAENEQLRATIEADRKIKLETMHEFLDKYSIDYDCGWRDAVDMLIDGLRAENQHLKDEADIMREALERIIVFCTSPDIDGDIVGTAMDALSKCGAKPDAPKEADND